MSIQKQDLENLKRAIEAEIKHQYIDLRGKKSTFSRYIANTAKNYYRVPPKNKAWAEIVILFSDYGNMSLTDRMKALNALQEVISQTIKTKKIPKIEDIEHEFEADTPDEGEKTELKKGKEQKVYIPDSHKPEDVEVQYIKGVGPVLGFKLNNLHIFNANDLLNYFPRDHIDFKNQTKIENIEIGDYVTIFGEIKNVSSYNSKRNPKLSITTLKIYDGTGMVTASLFLSRTNKFVAKKFKDQYPKGAQVLLSGKVKFDQYTQKKAIDKPEIEIVYTSLEDIESIHAARIVPIYKLTEGISIRVLRRAIYNAIESYLCLIEETLPESILKEYNLIDKKTAIKQIHFPDSIEELEKARKRLIFEEFFLHQMHLALIRDEIKSTTKAFTFVRKKGGLVDKFLKQLPFKLTDAQETAVSEIIADLSSQEPMHRLLQGDVGSGKTVVSCIALLTAIENGFQTAIMAPTEVLAEQHYRKFVEWLIPLGLSVGLFLGKHGVKIRREMKQSLESGQTNIAVGTHALIQEDVIFNNLGLVVIDEQHRFGVRQRTKLKNKGKSPELLTMTATPIPRTLALTMHGDLDVSTIEELPPGRKPIRTEIYTPRGRVRAYRMIEEEIKKKRQAFIVFPLIEESEKLAAKAATEEAKKLKETVFKDYSIGLVHGKLSNDVKEKEMEKFRNGEYDILVSTTVIEVGVDIPNATIMMIENADRFGLAQLHQLRGRVGRSKHQSYCILVTDNHSEDTRNRLSIMEKTNNGFLIAEYDLKLRGPGEFVGTKQSGLPDFMLANIIEHSDILELAREAVYKIIKSGDKEFFKKLLKKYNTNLSETFELLGSG